MIKRSINASIGIRLLRVVFGCYFIVALIMTIFHLFSEFLHSKEMVREEMVHYEHLLKRGFADALWTVNYDQLHSLLDGMKYVPSIVSVEIRNSDKTKILAAIGPPQNPSSNVDSSTFEYSFPINYEEPPGSLNLVGHAILRSNHSAILNRVSHSFFIIVINSIVKTLALWLIFLFFTRILVAKPLEKLTSLSKDLDPNNPKIIPLADQNMFNNRIDEVGVLGQTLVQMQNAVTEKIQQVENAYDYIHQLNCSLETEIERRTLETKVMLKNLSLGVCALNDKLIIQPEHSQKLNEIFASQDLVEQSLPQILFSDSNLDEDQCHMIVESLRVIIGSSEVNYDLNREHLPKHITKVINEQTKFLDLDWAPIIDHDIVKKMLLSIRDVTEIRRLESESRAKSDELIRIGRILAIPADQFGFFVDSLVSMLDNTENTLLSSTVAESWLEILRNLHTMKGNARSYGLLDLSSQVHLAEDIFHSSSYQHQQLPLYLQHIKDIRSIVQQYIDANKKHLNRDGFSESSSISEDIYAIVDELNSLVVLKDNLSPKFRKILSQLMHLHRIDFKNLLKPMTESLPNIAKESGHSPPVLDYRGETFFLTRAVAKAIEAVMIQLLRNSLAHGFEISKPGHIVIENFGISHNQTILRYSDNGRGVNIEKLRKIGLAKGLVSPNTTPQEIAQFVFRPDVSTASTLTSTAGRGIGLDAAKEIMTNIGGAINLVLIDDAAKEPGYVGFYFEIILPCAPPMDTSANLSGRSAA